MKKPVRGRKRPSRARTTPARPVDPSLDRQLRLGAFAALEAVALTCRAILDHLERSRSTSKPPRPPPKSGAQRVAEYRARKKAARVGVTKGNAVTERNGDPPPKVAPTEGSRVTNGNVHSVTDVSSLELSLSGKQEPSALKPVTTSSLQSERARERPIDRIARFWREQCLKHGLLSVFSFPELGKLHAAHCGKSEERAIELIGHYIGVCATVPTTPSSASLLANVHRYAVATPRPRPPGREITPEDTAELVRLHDEEERAALAHDPERCAAIMARIDEIRKGQVRQ